MRMRIRLATPLTPLEGLPAFRLIGLGSTAANRAASFYVSFFADLRKWCWAAASAP